jgi:cell wall-associated NlpC family hydrolase
MVSARDFVAKLLTQEGKKYIFGVEVSASNSDPAAFDCSELIEWVGARLGVVPRIPDGSWYQYRHLHQHRLQISIDKAIDTEGALLFSFSSSPLSGGRPRSSHVAVSLGDGRTIEARSTRYGTGIFSAYGRGWTHAGLVPGIDYTKGESEVSFTPEEEAALKDMVAYTKEMDSNSSWVKAAISLVRAMRGVKDQLLEEEF